MSIGIWRSKGRGSSLPSALATKGGALERAAPHLIAETPDLDEACLVEGAFEHPAHILFQLLPRGSAAQGDAAAAAAWRQRAEALRGDASP